MNMALDLCAVSTVCQFGKRKVMIGGKEVMGDRSSMAVG